MSIYQGRPRSSGYMDVHETPATPTDKPAGAGEPGDWLSLRKSRPVDRLLPIAERWSDGLPVELRPRVLMGLFPRIANLLAMQWNDLGALAAYFGDLLTDRRGHRLGFPPPVHDELLRLHDYAFRAHAG
jgi:hypothetical protein